MLTLAMAAYPMVKAPCLHLMRHTMLDMAREWEDMLQATAQEAGTQSWGMEAPLLAAWQALPQTTRRRQQAHLQQHQSLPVSCVM